MTAALIDSFGRHIDYVRLSVTDRCNLRCFYCLPERHRCNANAPDRLNDDELVRLVGIFAGLGVGKLRLTGGEPLVRRNLAALAARLARLPGLTDLSLSTNGLLLSKQAAALRQAGVARLNVSLDTLRPDRFAAATRGGRLEAVLEGLRAAQAAGFRPIRINMLALKGFNDDEFEDMVHFCRERGFTLRLIEPMPVGDPGRLGAAYYLDLQEVKRRLARTCRLTPSVLPGGGPARYYRIGETDVHVGFITALSRHFCQSCNRVRLSATGTLYLCLGRNDKAELGPLLRQGVGDDVLRDAILAAVARKPERHAFRERPDEVVRFMSQTGG